MVARAAADAGCRFFAGYPITPASEIFRILTEDLPARGGVAMAAPDEISALAYCVGASLRGVPSMTATSGPGWCLMIETLGYALMTEAPVVIAVVQRLGPSTGAATQGAQGDVALVSSAASGGYSYPVLTPSTAEECYDDTLRAFAWAERLRSPVVLLTDKEVASTAEVVDLGALSVPRAVRRPTWSGGDGFQTYGFSAPHEVPPFAPVGGPEIVTVTGSAHDRQGRLRKSDPETLDVLRHLQAKIDAAEPELGRIDVDPMEGADTLLLSFGVSARASRDALVLARDRGHRVALGTLRTLFPIPRTALEPLLEGIELVVVVEENHGGQYRQALASVLGRREVVGVNRVGALIRPQEIVDALG
jgi:2-oxoglutarate ferredoxin oxidoreductase subunit alpha